MEEGEGTRVTKGDEGHEGGRVGTSGFHLKRRDAGRRKGRERRRRKETKGDEEVRGDEELESLYLSRQG